MIHRLATLIALAAALTSGAARAQDNAPTPVPVVTVSASATATVPNDRLHAWLRAEADHPSAVTASADVNTRVARVLAKLKAALPDAQVATSGYTTQQIVEKGKPTRWRVVQTIKVEGGDFAAIGEAAARVQSEDGVLLSGISFGLSDELRRRTQDAITQQAIAAWRGRAQSATQGFGASGWRPGRIAIQAGTRDAPVVIDHRGQPRPSGLQCDKGAVEVQSDSANTTTTNMTTTTPSSTTPPTTSTITVEPSTTLVAPPTTVAPGTTLVDPPTTLEPSNTLDHPPTTPNPTHTPHNPPTSQPLSHTLEIGSPATPIIAKVGSDTPTTSNVMPSPAAGSPSLAMTGTDSRGTMLLASVLLSGGLLLLATGLIIEARRRTQSST